MHSRWRWAGSIVGVLAILLILIVIFFDWNWLKRPIEARLSALTGKVVHINGEITGTKTWIPHIVLPAITIDAPSFAEAPHVATIDSVAIEIDLKQLLRGRLSFPLIDVEKPVLDLLRDPNGASNWDLATDASGPSKRSAMPIIGQIRLIDGRVTYRDTGRRTTITATIASIEASGGGGQAELSLDGTGVYRDAPFTIKMKGGSLDELRDTENPYQLDIAASVGKTKVAIDGTVTDPFKLTDMKLKLTVDGDNAGDLYPLFGAPAPSTPPYHLTGTLDRDGKAWLFRHFTGTIGKSDISGDLRADPVQPRLRVSGNVVSRNLDFADLGMLIGAPGATSGDRPTSDAQRRLARKVAETDRVLPDAPLDLDEVRAIDADITFKAENIQAQTLPLENVDAHVKLDNAVLTFAPLDVGVAGGRIDSTITIDARTDTVVTDYDIRFHRFQIAQFFQHVGVSQAATGLIGGRIRLRGSGDSVRRSLASANGQASAIVGKGEISNLAADLLGLDIAKSLGVLISGSEKKIPMRCMVADFNVENGVMRPKAFVLDTDATVVTVSGSVSLGDERLDLSIAGEPKSPSPLALGGPIEIGGTFRSPTVGLGAAAIARGGAAVALGVLLTPLAAILGFIDSGDGEDADCQALEQQARTNAAKAPVRNRPAPVSAVRRSTAGG